MLHMDKNKAINETTATKNSARNTYAKFEVSVLSGDSAGSLESF